MANNPRKLALESLIKSEVNGSYTNIEIGTSLERNDLSSVDKRLYTLLYLGVIEKKLYLDYIISKYSRVKDIEIDIRCTLRLGLYQLIFCDKIPDYSAVSETVELCPKKAKGFVNAVLRSFLRDNKTVDMPLDKWQALSIKESIPCELIGLLRESYGDTEAYKLCTYNKRENYLSIRVNTLKSTREEIFDYLKSIDLDPKYSTLANDIILCSTQISQIKDLIDTGRVFIQDESSKIATEIFAPKRGEIIADMCACPGGKTFSCAIDMENEGQVYSSDLHKSKLKLIKDGALRLGIDIINVKEQNAKETVEDYIEKFDRVLLDVPCSGLGIMFKKPDIKYKSIESIENLPSVQYDILKSCARYVKKGGVLLYSTCTINKKENEDNIEKFLRENSSFRLEPFYVGNKKIEGGVYTFLPHIDNTDGFFVAKMVKIK